MKRLIIATKNDNKKKELKALLKGLGIEVLNFSDINTHIPTVIEDGKTFKQNAVKKALTFSHYIKGLILSDDSGIMVEALDGRPGVRSARFAHNRAKDEENNAKLLKLMKHVPAKKRQATFICVAALAEEGILLGTAEGKAEGMIGFELKGNNGFGYDPLFTPKGYNRTFAELKPTFKNRISHRGRAMKEARNIIQGYL